MDYSLFINSELVLSPEGHVFLDVQEQASEQLPLIEFKKIEALFAKGVSAGLLHLGIQEFSPQLPSSFLFWQCFSRHFITHLCRLNHGGDNQKNPVIPIAEKEALERLMNQAPFIKGMEYLNADVLLSLWQKLGECFRQELEAFSGYVQDYLSHFNPRWNLVGRICFHLAENKNNESKPFAFLATYTTHLSQHSKEQHLPLRKALQDYSNEKNHAGLLALLLPIQKAANESPFIKKLVDSGEIYQTLTWNAREAHQFLQAIPLIESNGVMVRIPNWWNPRKPTRPNVVVKLGENQKSLIGLQTLLNFDIHLALNNGEELTNEEWESLLSSNECFVKIKGHWVEVDRDKLKDVLAHWNQIKKGAQNGLTMAESLRLLAGSGSALLAKKEILEPENLVEWSTLEMGDWLKKTLAQLKNPDGSGSISIEKELQNHLQASLRPYQKAGVQWLWLLYQLKLGGCLADDMGLGKTIQVLSLLLLIKHSSAKHTIKKPHLLIVPASLLGNWQSEIARFSPSLKMMIAHHSANQEERMLEMNAAQLTSIDLVMTTYPVVQRLEWLKEVEWDLLLLDEAQLIKNPDAKQTKAVKGLKSHLRFALTGTPIENRLNDLWSLFDFIFPGLLGSRGQFSGYAKKANKDNFHFHAHFISSLRRLTQPYILRRLKNDKKVISDLPDKTEMLAYCSLSKEQVDLYQQAIHELKDQLKEVEGMKRRGLVLSYLLRFKQICNHPAQWLGYGEYAQETSGKFLRLQEICEEIGAKQEKVLIFTQFREIIPHLSTFLAQIFGREGLMLHGETPVKKRAELVASFQQDRGPPFFVLSLKAGGTGLNLTRASHVIHFDRWWNPAVENQATDRAYRIGQKHPVLVHKFICKGTIEEKIDLLISSKKSLSQELLEGDNELLLSELSDDELLNVVSLDIKKALGNF